MDAPHIPEVNMKAYGARLEAVMWIEAQRLALEERRARQRERITFPRAWDARMQELSSVQDGRMTDQEKEMIG